MDWSMGKSKKANECKNEATSIKIKSQTDWVHIGINFLNIIGVLLTVWAFYWAYKNQLFTSTEALNQFLSSMGSAAPFGFIVIQIIQTVIPIIPGAITVPMGAIIFGPVYGLFLNVFAIIIGSILNFVLARKYGQPFVERIIGEKKFARTVSWLDKDDKFEKWFTYAMFFPFSPDDILCYIAGLSKMSFKKYFLIILFGKPVSILLYSFGTVFVLEWLFIFLA